MEDLAACMEDMIACMEENDLSDQEKLFLPTKFTLKTKLIRKSSENLLNLVHIKISTSYQVPPQINTRASHSMYVIFFHRTP